ncbi:uncharacterized protein LY89DRAFT_682173 [Mollisia scopiformis]|uniref:Uncharacterized protein n=1 Tax=Mollisia scopiformis TaxID=149040 RepID=A0A194XJW7_MOLSC|nr:uncharacterized protein LY89DRAFT_682173 [Mollisia scopiformis]KUJ20431.1 hypothetical protein LY89DRAFT_682173 [Mollisia scopiformis]
MEFCIKLLTTSHCFSALLSALQRLLVCFLVWVRILLSIKDPQSTPYCALSSSSIS